MIVDNFHRANVGNLVEFSADFSTSTRGDTFRVVISTPKEFASVHIPYDSFYTLAMPLTISLGESLYFAGTVSRKLYGSLKKVGKYFGHGKKNRLDAKVDKTVIRKSRGVVGYGQFFTLGIDSFYSLLSNVANKDNNLGYLIYVDGFDIRNEQRGLLDKTHANIIKVAEYFDKKAIFAMSNIRELSDKIISWEQYHGAALAGVGHILRDKIGGMYISTSDVHTYPIMWGTGVEIDKLWSSESRWYEAYGIGLNRYNKASFVVNDKNFDFVSGLIKVCWMNSCQNIDDLNCCRCEKCLRSYLTLLAAGAPKKIGSFPNIYYSDFETVELPYGLESAIAQWYVAYLQLKKMKNMHDLVSILDKRFELDEKVGNKMKIFLNRLSKVFKK